MEPLAIKLFELGRLLELVLSRPIGAPATEEFAAFMAGVKELGNACQRPLATPEQEELARFLDRSAPALRLMGARVETYRDAMVHNDNAGDDGGRGEALAALFGLYGERLMKAVIP